MCRSIKVLRRPGIGTSADEVSSAALQFVRKISGFHKPSRANQEAFDRAVREVADASQRLLGALGVQPAGDPPIPGDVSEFARVHQNDNVSK